MKTKTTTANPRLLTPFAVATRARIAAKVKWLKRTGTVEISIENLVAITGPTGPEQFLKGAPLGTNGPYYYRELAREVIADMPELKRFATL